MSSSIPSDVLRAQEWLAAHEQEMLEDLRSVLRIPSIESDPEPNAPFGKACREALDFVLDLGHKWGMTTKDVEGYAGHAEFGDAEPMVMSLGHLDVVPVGTGWKHEPFGAEIDGEYLYARGTSDDKGPTMAAFYAARALKETAANLPARIRLVFGCDEESGFKCVERYFQTEEHPTYGIAPDSGWPLYHAEKGIANFIVSAPCPVGEITVISITGGSRPNIVIDSAKAEVKVAATATSRVAELIEEYWDKNVTASFVGDTLSISASGKSAHGSTPFMGDNAVTRILRLLLALVGPEQQRVYTNLLMVTHPSGAGLGIHGEDEVSKDLTSNLGIIETNQGRLEMTINVRYPVTWKGDKVESAARAFVEDKIPGATIRDFDDSPSLYFPLNAEPVTSLMEAYEAEVGDGRQPGVMGGGTYARAVPNSVSVGTGWEGDGPAHEPDERIKVAHVLRMAQIYTHMLYKLAHAAAKK